GPGLAFAGALLMLALAFLGLWLYGLIELLSLRYLVDRNGVEIRTASARQTIPHAAIQRIDFGEAAGAPSRLRGIAWPGYMRGTLSATPFGRIAVWATEPLQRQLILVTDEMCYAISPADRAGFVQRYHMRRELGALESLPQRLTPVGIASWTVWRDRVFWLAMALGLALSAGLAALTAASYSSLPAIVPLHWGATGQPDRLAPRLDVFAIPAIGAAVLLANLALAVGVHHRERLGARLLAWGTIAAQLALWAAAWQVLGL
ncbi:MAG: PH domain-containing protein, partial [Anaerolineae bacterium]